MSRRITVTVSDRMFADIHDHGVTMSPGAPIAPSVVVRGVLDRYLYESVGGIGDHMERAYGVILLERAQKRARLQRT